MLHALLAVPSRPGTWRAWTVAAALLQAVLLHGPSPAAHKAPAWAYLAAICLAACTSSASLARVLACLLACRILGHLCVTGALGDLRQGLRGVSVQ
jgi:hypothetical protein